MAAGFWAGLVEGPGKCQPCISHFYQINSNFCKIIFTEIRQKLDIKN
jgi:hypothetical protein